MYNPRATYRLQFHKGFSFKDFEKALPYFKRLGMGTIYASPIFEAVSGSTHGYDGLNPHNINPEIGTEEQFCQLAGKLKKDGIGWLQDIVPNHMAFDTANMWLMDVLEKGQKSRYASFFDMAWTGEIFHGRMMVPFLGSPLKEVIENGELKVEIQNQRLVFNYADTYYPLNNISYTNILQQCSTENDSLRMLLSQLQSLRHVEDPLTYQLEWDEFLLQFSSLMKNDAAGKLISESLERISGDAVMLSQIAEEQAYQLSYWQRTDTRINFRRFFTVNGLIALNIHNPDVFAYHHKYIKQLVDDGFIQGLRIDHIDGLYDPTAYLHQLRALAGDEAYIVVEKILEPGEELVNDWPIQGNSGYDYLAIVNNLFTNKNSADKLTTFYNELVQDDTPLPLQIREKKALILAEYMSGELDNLTALFKRLGLATPAKTDSLGKDELSLAIGEFLIHCPVYRYYGNSLPLAAEEAANVRAIFKEVRNNRAELNEAIDLLEDALLTQPQKKDPDYNKGALRFYQRCMQYTGPLMAKGVEDTLMYTYNRFIAHNEVGDAPEAFGILPDEYHQLMIDRQLKWPLSINATSTHDTKRGEDARARLNVLSDLPDEWLQKVNEWRQMNAGLKVNGAPDDNDEYFIYQTLLGVYAMPGQFEDDILNRLQEYLQKALREAKVNSTWATPDEAYEQAVKDFAVLLFDKQKPFWQSFTAFHEKIAGFGVINSLVQVLLRFTSPGVPDTYQGTELWDLSLVDPDNRRAVDYDLLQMWLSEIDEAYQKQPRQCLANLWADRFSPKIKLWLTQFLYRLRESEVEIFAKGTYVPVKVLGAYNNNVIAFGRSYKEKTLVIVAPLHLAAMCDEQQKSVAEIDWKDTKIELPANMNGAVKELVSQSQTVAAKELPVQGLFANLPFAILQIEQVKEQPRAAGLLMHITSLPSPFGIGDLGPEAYKFVDFLKRTCQTYWQILPLNPTEEGQGHSPYSSTSSRAGNTLLISPELLIKEGLLTEEEVQKNRLEPTAKVDFERALTVRNDLFSKAWLAFGNGKGAHLQNEFEAFCKQENNWLNDYATYILLKQKFNNKPWFEWPAPYKIYDVTVTEQLMTGHEEEIKKTKWLQFIFVHQWKELRTYSSANGIKLFGDLPFYASYDSVDVWSNPTIFSVDAEGKMLQVAGVPPDHFSADGQLWGMPVFNWEVLKADKYKWWIERLRKNMELFDLVRLDHFRAFANYWQVPAGENTAVKGEWMNGPGADFFREVKRQWENLPFVAEDLGEIDEPVHALRLAFNMPGMKVLQFAFGDGLPKSNYIPHNYTEDFLVYTGTHDNNTTKGWHRRDATGTEKENLNRYAGRLVPSDDVADILMRMAYGSVAKTAIVPIQDLLALDENARMNKPGSIKNNWSWRLLPHQLEGHVEKHLKFLTELYNRG